MPKNPPIKFGAPLRYAKDQHYVGQTKDYKPWLTGWAYEKINWKRTLAKIKPALIQQGLSILLFHYSPKLQRVLAVDISQDSAIDACKQAYEAWSDKEIHPEYLTAMTAVNYQRNVNNGGVENAVYAIHEERRAKTDVPVLKATSFAEVGTQKKNGFIPEIESGAIFNRPIPALLAEYHAVTAAASIALGRNDLPDAIRAKLPQFMRDLAEEKVREAIRDRDTATVTFKTP